MYIMKRAFIITLLFMVFFIVFWCFICNDYEVLIEVPDEDATSKGDWHYESEYYSVPEATINTIKEDWGIILIVSIIVFFIAIKALLQVDWDYDHKDRWGKNTTYGQRRALDEHFGIGNFGNKK